MDRKILKLKQLLRNSKKCFFNSFMKIIIPPFGYQEDFCVRTFEIDSTKSATLPAIVQLMQEAAMQNVIDIKLSIWDLEPHKISWVVMRKNMTINRLPVLGEKIQILTYPAGFEKFFTYRDFHSYTLFISI
jgi:acyl-ACP thioesterase